MNPLRKRYKRELFDDLPKNLALFLFLAFLIGVSSGYIVAGDSLVAAYDTSFEKYNIEDGHFTLSREAPDELLRKLQEQKITVYPLFYQNRQTAQGDDVRIYAVRKAVNRQDIMKGRLPEDPGEIVIDRLYAENNGISLGDIMQIGGTDYTVCAFAAFSDYSALFQHNSDTMFDANHFTVAAVTQEAFDRLPEDGVFYCYAYTFNDSGIDDSRAKRRSDRILKRLIKLVEEENGSNKYERMLTYLGLLPELKRDFEIENFLARQDNQAITFTGEDFGRDRIMMEYLLYIIMVLMAFIFGVTTKSGIEREASAIGTLRALGFTRGEMLLHYLTIPTAITLAAALVGNLFGYTVMKSIAADLYYHSYSLPTFVTVWNADAFLRTTIMPCVIVMAVETLVIRRTLLLSPLDFLRHDLKKHGKNRRAVNLRYGSFLHRMRMRVILQNRGAYAAILFGVLFANLLLAFGLIFSPLLKHYEGEVQNSMAANYQYVLSEPEATRTPGAEKYSMISLENDAESVSVYGLIRDTGYFGDMHMEDILPDDRDSDRVIISSAYASKYKLKKGDEISLHEKYGSRVYDFTVDGVYSYPASISVYMPLAQFNETFDFEEDDYTGYFSDKKITDIDEDRIETEITEQDLAVVARQLEDSMGMMFPIFGGFATVLYILTIYLLAKVVVEKNERWISMLKILGFFPRETSRIYNTATAVVVVVSMFLSIPVVALSMRGIYALLMLELSGYITYYVPLWLYPAILSIGIGGYLFVHLLQMRRIRRIPLGTALKDMDQ